MSELVVQGVSRTFPGRPPVAALVDASLLVSSGSVVAILGPSGCGKSTLLRCIAGFERPDTGTITIAGRHVVADGLEVRPERRNVGIVPQAGALFPHLDVAANVAFGLRSLDRGARERRVADLLELTGLHGLGHRRPSELSGGQQQRVALARALAPQPDVVLLDEPFSALDADLRASLRAEVAALLRATTTTAVIVTHDQGEALAMANQVAVMRDGAIVQVATPRDLYRHPVDLRTARSIGAGTTLTGEARGRTATCAFGEVEIDNELSGAVTLLIRPEQVTPDPVGPLLATVVSASFSGHDQTVELDIADSLVTARWPADATTTVGSVHKVRILGAVLAYSSNGTHPPGS